MTHLLRTFKSELSQPILVRLHHYLGLFDSPSTYVGISESKNGHSPIGDFKQESEEPIAENFLQGIEEVG